MKYQGLFHGSYQPKFMPASMELGKLCHAYAGLGGAYSGMYQEYFHNSYFRKTFEVVDNESEALGLLPISHYILKPEKIPPQQLHLFQMLSIFTTQVAVGQLLTDKLGAPDFLTGHSFGETALLVVDGVVPLDQMAKTGLLRVLSYPAMFSLGGMLAVGASVEALKDIFELPDVYLANVNSRRQLVLSFHLSSEKILTDALRKKRIPFVKMEQLPHPYHSPLLDKYRLNDLERIGKLRLKISPPRIPIYSGTTQQWITASNFHEINWPDLLSRQIFNPVDFTRQVEELRQKGVTRFYEIGSGRMIGMFLKGTYHSKQYVYRSAPEMLSALLDEESKKTAETNLDNSAWFARIRDTLTKVTGYKKEEITLQQKFQDDLGIDSLKKAEILLGVFSPPMGKAQDYNPDRFDTIYDAVKYLENYSVQEDPLSFHYESEIDFFVPAWRFSPHFNVSEIPQGRVVEVAFSTRLFTYCHGQALRSDETLIFRMSFHGPHLLDLLELAQLREDYADWVKNKDQKALSLCLVDMNAEGASASFFKLLLTLARESRQLRVCHITSDQNVSDEDIMLEFATSPTTPIRYVGAQRSVRIFEKLVLPKEATRAPQTIVSLGGSRGMGFEILKRFPIIAGDRLVLVGRTSADRLTNELEILQKHWGEFFYIVADARDSINLSSLLATHLPDRRVDCLLNMTGQELSQNFEHKSAEEIKLEFESKWLPFLSITRLKESFNIARTLHFSSIVAHFGNIGQSIYGYANALIEREARTQEATAIGWAPWEGIGMTSQPGIIARHRAWGLSLISPDRGAQLAHHLMLSSSSLPQVIVPMDHKEVLLLNFQLIRDEKKGGYQNLHQAIFYHDVEQTIDQRGDNLRPSYYLAHVLGLWRELFARTPSLGSIKFYDPLALSGGKATFKFQIYYRKPFQFKAFTVFDHFSCEVDPHVTIRATASEIQNLEKVPGKGGSDFEVWLNIFDRVFQRFTAQTDSLPQRELRITRIGAFALNEAITDKKIGWISTEVKVSASGKITGTASLLNEKHEVVAQFQNVIFE